MATSCPGRGGTRRRGPGHGPRATSIKDRDEEQDAQSLPDIPKNIWVVIRVVAGVELFAVMDIGQAGDRTELMTPFAKFSVTAIEQCSCWTANCWSTTDDMNGVVRTFAWGRGGGRQHPLVWIGTGLTMSKSWVTGLPISRKGQEE